MFPISDDEKDARNDAWQQRISSQVIKVKHVGKGDFVQLCPEYPFLEVVKVDDLPSGFVRLHLLLEGQTVISHIIHRDDTISVEVVNLEL